MIYALYILVFILDLVLSLPASFRVVIFFKQKTAYEMRISDWSSDVCSSDLEPGRRDGHPRRRQRAGDDGDMADAGALFQHHALQLAPVVIQQQIGRASCRESVCQYV